MEIHKHAVALGLNASADFLKATRRLEGIGGLRGYFAPPTQKEFQEAVKRRLDAVAPLERIGWTPEHVESALKRVIDELPPNGSKNQQFKDSLIWEAVCQLADIAPVHFLTRDKGFFEQRETGKGLAQTLVQDLAKRGFPVKAYEEIAKFLKELGGKDSALALRAAIGEIASQSMLLIHEDVLGCRLSVGPLDSSGSEVLSFPLIEPDAEAAKFHLKYYCQRIVEDRSAVDGGKRPIPGCLHIFGACKVTSPNVKVSDLQVHHADFNSPSFCDGKIWVRISNECGDRGPLPVENGPQWIVQPDPKDGTDDGRDYYYHE
jgi:hypothetical protein